MRDRTPSHQHTADADRGWKRRARGSKRPRKTGLRVLQLTCVVLVCAVAGLAVLRVGTGTSRLPERGVERRTVVGLDTNVLIRIDVLGVPHVRAGSTADLWFAQGYVHARDRFFQMELARRTAKGCLSEIFGDRMLQIDRMFRTWRLAAAGRRQVVDLDRQELDALTAYTRGVNAAIEEFGRWLAPELVLLDVRPVPWTVEDSVAVGLLLSVRERPAMMAEIERAIELDRLGREVVLDLWGWSRREARRWIPDIDLDTQPMDVSEPFRPPFGSSIGTAWAIGGHRTGSGYPIVTVDPVDRVIVPVAWYVMHLQCPGVQLAGLSVPGVPAIVSGHTDQVAWGLIPSGFDDQDLFRLEVDETGRRERIDDRWWNLRIVVDEIGVRGYAEPVLHEVKVSRVGPVVRERNREALAMAWCAFEGRTPIGALLRTATAASIDDVVDAWDGVGGSAFNVVAADRDGGISHHLVGSLPVRGRGAGRLPSPGADSSWHWIGQRTIDDGFARTVSGDGMVVAGTFDPFSEGDLDTPRDAAPGDFDAPWRRRRIVAALERSTRWDIISTLELQTDLRDSRAAMLLQLMRPDLQEHGGPTARELLSWDGRMQAESVAASRYVHLVHHLCAAVGDDEAVRDGLARGVITPDRLTALLGGAIRDDWWDDVRTIRRESRREIIASVLDDLDQQRRVQAWGDLHRIEVQHVLGGVPLLKDAWSRGPFFVGGSDATLLVSPCRSGSGETEVCAASAWQSARLIMDLGNWDHMVAVLPMGQSGRVWSQHYDDSQGDWLHGRPRLVPFSEERIEEQTKARIILVASFPPSVSLDQPSKGE